jgi:hypothetical protein
VDCTLNSGMSNSYRFEFLRKVSRNANAGNRFFAFCRNWIKFLNGAALPHCIGMIRIPIGNRIGYEKRIKVSI